MDNFTAEMFADFDAYQDRMENTAIPYEESEEAEADYIPGLDDGEEPCDEDADEDIQGEFYEWE